MDLESILLTLPPQRNTEKKLRRGQRVQSPCVVVIVALMAKKLPGVKIPAMPSMKGVRVYTTSMMTAMAFIRKSMRWNDSFPSPRFSLGIDSSLEREREKNKVGQSMRLKMIGVGSINLFFFPGNLVSFP